MPTLLLKTEEETEYFAVKLATYCPKDKRFIIFLSGELGAGKTVFVRAFIKSFGYTDLIKSPTYTLIEPYQIATHTIYHLDLYRLQAPLEILDMGLYDEFDRPAIWLIEWPERAIAFLPKPDLVFNFSSVGFARQIQYNAETSHGHHVLALFKKLTRTY